jgi:hypothetical protein
VCRSLKSPIRFSPEDNFSRSFPQAPDPHFRSFPSTLPFPSTLQSPTGLSACVIHGSYTPYGGHNSHMHSSGHARIDGGSRRAQLLPAKVD